MALTLTILGHNTPPPHVIFRLRQAASLTCKLEKPGGRGPDDDQKYKIINPALTDPTRLTKLMYVD